MDLAGLNVKAMSSPSAIVCGCFTLTASTIFVTVILPQVQSRKQLVKLLTAGRTVVSALQKNSFFSDRDMFGNDY